MNLSVLISGLLTLSLFFLLHFFVTPIQEKRKNRIEQLTNLYAPLYGLLVARLEVGKQITPKRLTLGSIVNHDFLTKESADKLIYDNIGYASIELIAVWADYTSSTVADHQLQLRLVEVVVKDFNQLRKKLKLPYNETELKTGIPENVKQFRY